MQNAKVCGVTEVWLLICVRQLYMRKLLVQPGAGVAPLVKAITEAKKSIDILIFRFDRREVETALVKAVNRGVLVRALIAYTNRGGERSLRALEMRLLEAGVTVARTNDDLVRYHGKMLIVDEETLYVMGFNWTVLDMEKSRSFALITDEKDIVAEAVKLFEADSRRVDYEPKVADFVVSPVNSREALSGFIKKAKKELRIYDPAVNDPSIARLLDERAKSGVRIRILGRMSRKLAGVEVRTLFMRLHSRVIVRDEEDIFLGSQSLRTAELEARREIGVIFNEAKIAASIIETFDQDWERSHETKRRADAQDDDDDTDNLPTKKVAKKVAKTVIEELPPVAPVLETVVKELAGSADAIAVNPAELEATVKDAVKTAIREVVADVVQAGK